MREDFFSFELRATTRSKSELGRKDDFYNRLCKKANSISKSGVAFFGV